MKNAEQEGWQKKFDHIFERWVPAMLEDLRRTLEVTCHFSGDRNSGSNFLGNMVILTGLELLAKLNAPFRNPIGKKKKAPKKPLRFRDIDATKAAKRFIKRYFNPIDPRYGRFAEMVWIMFRNGHVHTFLPKIVMNIPSHASTIFSAVDWAYDDPASRVGITIANLEREIANNGRTQVIERLAVKHLSLFRDVKGSIVFSMCPQIFLIDFKQAIEKFKHDLRTVPYKESLFLRGYNAFRRELEIEFQDIRDRSLKSSLVKELKLLKS